MMGNNCVDYSCYYVFPNVDELPNTIPIEIFIQNYTPDKVFIGGSSKNDYYELKFIDPSNFSDDKCTEITDDMVTIVRCRHATVEEIEQHILDHTKPHTEVVIDNRPKCDTCVAYVACNDCEGYADKCKFGKYDEEYAWFRDYTCDYHITVDEVMKLIKEYHGK